MKKPYIVGIAGGSASGKSTFADKLEKNLESFSVKIFHMDHYFKEEKDRPYSKSPAKDISYVDDNHPLTMDIPALQIDLKNATQMDFDIIILEGLLILWDDEIYSHLDLKLFVDCRPDERIVRRLKRNMEWGLTFDEISNVYLDLVRFRHDEYVETSKWKTDFILNGSNFSEVALKIITDAITSSVPKK